eukprot:1757221-Alexandrium_andersonii.AAC.1
MLDPLDGRAEQIDDIALVSSDDPSGFPLPLQLLHHRSEDCNRAMSEHTALTLILRALPDLREEL